MSKTRSNVRDKPDWNDETGILQAIENLVNNNPIQALNMLRGFHKNSMKGHRRRTKATIVHAYACALKLKDNKKLISNFYDQEFFRRRKHQLKEAKLLRMTLCFIVGGLEGSDYGQALSYERAIRSFFERGADASELREALDKRTIDELEREAKAAKDARKLNDCSRPETASHGEHVDTDDDGSDSENQSEHEVEEAESDASSSEADRSSQPAVAKNSPGAKRTLKLTDLRLVSTDEFSHLVLDHPNFVKGVIEYEREETNPDFKRVIVTHVREL